MADTTAFHVLMSPGIRETFFNALTSTGDNKSSAFAIQRPLAGQTRTATWETIPNVNADAIALELQGAMTDTEADFTIIDTSTAVAGEMKTVALPPINFLRVRQSSRTNGTDITVKVTVS